jgi:antitoxin MazE
VQAAFGLLIQLGHTQDWVRGQQLTNLRRATIVLTLCQRKLIMEVAIRKMGNSQGVLIPKPILIQVGLDGTADLQVRNGVIEIRAVRRNPREGWADDARRLAELGGDALVWPEVANEGDHELVW